MLGIIGTGAVVDRLYWYSRRRMRRMGSGYLFMVCLTARSFWGHWFQSALSESNLRATTSQDQNLQSIIPYSRKSNSLLSLRFCVMNRFPKLQNALTFIHRDFLSVTPYLRESLLGMSERTPEQIIFTHFIHAINIFSRNSDHRQPSKISMGHCTGKPFAD